MSAEEADAYLRGAEEPKRSTLETLRRTILEIAPQAAQVISYGVPAFRAGGRTVAGIAAFEDHLSYLPFSGSVLRQPADEHDGYTMTKSSLRFPVDRALPNGQRRRAGRSFRAVSAYGPPRCSAGRRRPGAPPVTSPGP